MDVGQLKDDVRAGRIGVDRLVEVIASLQRQLQESQRRVAELEKQLGAQAVAKIDEAFSVRAEEKRQEARGKVKPKRQRSGRRGRVSTAEKVKRAERTEKCFPKDVAEADCRLSHTRIAWRLESGRAVLVAYEIYRARNGRYGQIPGVLGRSEFGLEIVVAISFLVHIIGLSFDKVCLLMGFFQQLTLSKSQVDALLTQLARHWEGEFERLCTLLANSAIVHADETGWSLRLMLAEELFTFVTAAPVTTPTGETLPVPPTNNAAEQAQRLPATCRDTGRTSKTFRGARRRTIHVSVLESLRCYLSKLTLSSVIAEVQSWLDTGRSCFARQLEKLKLATPTHSVLDSLFPEPSD